MSQVRNIVKSFRVETAKSERKCHASSQHAIAPGETHFAYQPTGAGRENICKKYASVILDKAAQHIVKVKNELGV